MIFCRRHVKTSCRAIGKGDAWCLKGTKIEVNRPLALKAQRARRKKITVSGRPAIAGLTIQLKNLGALRVFAVQSFLFFA